ncbi:MAG: hypothetical protein HYZ20_07185 [Burkholderiales bacterium]|nr:hypothetical protein [Burkholderiales bacterium]
MTIADQILADLRAALARRKLPRVRSLHLPASALRQSKDGEFGALALEDGSLGLSYLLLGATLAGLDAGGHHDALAGADALALAARWKDPDPAWQAVGFAAVNALTRHLMDAAGFMPPSASDSIAGLDPQPGEAIGMVGFFPPLVPQIVARGARLTVLELRADLAGERDGYTVTLDPAALAPCRKVLATSTVLLNRSFDAVADAVRGAEVFALVGPSAGCLPDALFRRGVTRIGGTWVSDPAALVAAIESGTPWGSNARKFSLERADYPGWPALVAAAGR